MNSIQNNPEPYMATLAAMLIAEGQHDAANVVRQADFKCEATAYDNWNGGTTYYTIQFIIDAVLYAQLGARRNGIEEQINTRLPAIYEQSSTDAFSAKIYPKVTERENWRDVEKSGVSRSVRQNIIDGLKLEEIKWNGQLDDVDFLQRVFDLATLPSYDSRFKTAAQDIWQHRFNNDDWPDDWVYEDDRFALRTCPTDVFLRFLCEIVHPVVRPDRDQAIKIAQQFNEQLLSDGWRLIEEEKIAGRPRYVAVPSTSIVRSVSRARTVADALNAGSMQKQIERMEKAIENDPSLAIGTAKELVESCCKSILSEREVAYKRDADIPELVKLVTRELKLVPDDIPDSAKGAEIIRLLLRNFAAQTKYLAELRSLYGTGHGRDGKHKGLEPRHARLAVGAAAVFIDFLTETYRRRAFTAPEAVTFDDAN